MTAVVKPRSLLKMSSTLLSKFPLWSLIKQSYIKKSSLFSTLSSSPSFSVRYNSTLSLSHPSVQKYFKKLQQDDTSSSNSELSRVVRAIVEKQNEVTDLLAMGRESSELREIAEADAEKARKALEFLEREFFESVLEPDPMDNCCEVMLEVSAGVGGQEAMLFSNELFEMYANYANYKGWECNITELGKTDIGGIRRASLSISGSDAYKLLKFEGGVHRVQRVPKTERAGRIHTSASSVAVLPAPTDIDVVINPQDLKVETKKASGAGGQHVNTTESAVRITHIPTGIAVECQTERSQIKNRSNALRILRTKIYQQKAESQAAKMRSTRKLQVGLGGRNEKIRTYNYVQDRVTDHRIGLTVYNLKGVLSGDQSLDDIIEKLQNYDMQDRLEEMFK